MLFAIEIPANFERAVRRGDRPALLVAADATDPVAAGSAMAALGTLVQTALRHDRAIPDGAAPPFEIRTHARYNPAANTSFNIVPGLVGTILTMTMLIFTALSVTREIERGTMESLLAMPITPVEIMLGKIIPYIIVGFVQAALIIGMGIGLFGVPLLGSLVLLALLSTLFITTNLSVGYTFSTIAQNQLQAMQMSMMFFLPNILLSGFMFPFAGMPAWAQWIGEFLPLTHYLRIVRGIMLKGAALADLRYDTLALAGLDADRDDHRDQALPPHAGLEGTRRLAKPRRPGCAARDDQPGASGAAPRAPLVDCECSPPGSQIPHKALPALAGPSVSAISPSERMPTRRLSRSSTGSRRTLMSAMFCATSSRSSSSKQYFTSSLMISRIGVSGLLPAPTARMAISRSVIIPTR